jgi:molecular chaperone GrpE
MTGKMNEFEKFMRKHIKNSESEGAAVDVDHELPPAEGAESADATVSPASEAAEGAIDRLAREKLELLDRMARMQAEFDNARKRAAREQQEFREYATAGAITPLLPILDSLERAVHFEDASAADLRAGVELIYKQLLDALAKLGLHAIHAKGTLFDPNLHQAIEMVDTEEVPDQHVFDELQPGYKLKERLLRPAMVRVARNTKA